MTVSGTDRTDEPDDRLLTLSTTAARRLATTTKTVPQSADITPRWLSRSLPWIEAQGGTFRVNRRRVHAVGDGIITFTSVGTELRVIPAELGELPILRGFTDEEALAALADRFEQHRVPSGEVIAEFGGAADRLYLIGHGKVNKVATGEFGDPVVLDTLGEGAHLGVHALVQDAALWEYTATAVTPCVLLSISRRSFDELLDSAPRLRDHVRSALERPKARQNRSGEAEIELSSGHDQETGLTATFADYDPEPREYELSVAQTVLRIHTRVADLYNQPMDQVEQQLRLTVRSLRERQESELFNNPDFGLLAAAHPKQRIHTRTGPPTPDDLDELVSRRRKSRVLLAHPRTIAAFGRECNRRGVYPGTTEVDGTTVTAWRGVPLLPSDKIPISREGTSSVLVLRTGLDDEGVIGLHRTDLPDEVEPGLNIRFMGIDDKAIISYLVSAYYSVAVLVPDALGVLENVEIGR